MIILHWSCSTGNGWCSSLPFSICGRTPSVQKTIQQVEEMRKLKRVFPPPQDVFKAFLATPLEKVRVVIVGQDSWLHDKVRKNMKNLTCDRISTCLRVKLLKCGLTLVSCFHCVNRYLQIIIMMSFTIVYTALSSQVSVASPLSLSRVVNPQLEETSNLSQTGEGKSLQGIFLVFVFKCLWLMCIRQRVLEGGCASRSWRDFMYSSVPVHDSPCPFPNRDSCSYVDTGCMFNWRRAVHCQMQTKSSANSNKVQ